MPQSKEVHKEYMRKKRADEKPVEMVPPAYIQGITGVYEFLPERRRYLTLSDGQVLDRTYNPTPNIQTMSMNHCNESMYNYHPTKGR